jgi:hypothetical protein
MEEVEMEEEVEEVSGRRKDIDIGTYTYTYTYTHTHTHIHTYTLTCSGARSRAIHSPPPLSAVRLPTRAARWLVPLRLCRAKYHVDDERGKGVSVSE